MLKLKRLCSLDCSATGSSYSSFHCRASVTSETTVASHWCRSDLRFYLRNYDNEIDGMMEKYVEGICAVGHDSLSDIMYMVKGRYQINDIVYDGHTFYGLIKSVEKTSLHKYTNKGTSIVPKNHPKSWNFDGFLSRRHTLAWLSQTRPEICATANILSQITKDTLNENQIQDLKRALKSFL